MTIKEVIFLPCVYLAWDTNGNPADWVNWESTYVVDIGGWLGEAIQLILDKIHDAVVLAVAEMPQPFDIKPIFKSDYAWRIVTPTGEVPTLTGPDTTWNVKPWYMHIGNLYFGLRYEPPTEMYIDGSEEYYYESNGEYKQGKDFTPQKQLGIFETLKTALFDVLILGLITLIGSALGGSNPAVTLSAQKLFTGASTLSTKSWLRKNLDENEAGSLMNNLKTKILAEVAKSATQETLKTLFGLDSNFELDEMGAKIQEILNKVLRMRGSSYGS